MLNPPISISPGPVSGRLRRSHSGGAPRTANRSKTLSPARRVSENRSAAVDAASSHWRSSIARQIGRSAARSRTAARKAAATARASA